jgi:tetratricopeptide (TPR) repeat protein
MILIRIEGLNLARRIIFITIFFLFPFFVFSQNSVSLESEIRNIEQIVSNKDSTPSQKHDAHVKLAGLRQLSGDYEGAARNWLDAAAAIPGNVDDEALFSCALCLALTGEWERASKALEPLLFKSADARFLEASMLAWRSGDISALLSILNLSDYAHLKAQIYFMLWKVSANDSYKNSLVAEFPQSPEAAVAADATSIFSVKINPLWLYISGRDVITQMETAAVSTITQTAALSSQTVTLPVAAQAPESAAQNVSAQEPSARIQTGVFSRQSNADELTAKLKQAGFTPMIEQRTVNGNVMWAVIVPAGNDVNVSIRELRAAGFVDSFPIK